MRTCVGRWAICLAVLVLGTMSIAQAQEGRGGAVPAPGAAPSAGPAAAQGERGLGSGSESSTGGASSESRGSPSDAAQEPGSDRGGSARSTSGENGAPGKAKDAADAKPSKAGKRAAQRSEGKSDRAAGSERPASARGAEGKGAAERTGDKPRRADERPAAARQAEDKAPGKPAAAQNAEGKAAPARAAAHVDLSGDKQSRVRDALRQSRDIERRTKVDIDISIGRRLPRDWHYSRIPTPVIDVVPQYRDYVFVYVGDEYVIADPDDYEVVAVIPAEGSGQYAEGGGGGGCPSSLRLSRDDQSLILDNVGGEHAVDVSDLSVGWSVPGDIELRQFPAPVLSEASQLGACRYFVARDQLAIVDPRQDKVVLVIDKS